MYSNILIFSGIMTLQSPLIVGQVIMKKLIIERETLFSFKIEFPYHLDEREEVIKLFRQIKMLIDTGYLRVGAKTNNGFGVLKISEYLCSDYNLMDRKELSSFLQNKHLKKYNS